jgi:hypothetical protein
MRRLYTETPEQSMSDYDASSMSNYDASSMSDVAASTTDSDVFSESASMTDTETAIQSGDGEDVSDEDIVIPVSNQKRQKSLRPSPARKRTKRSGKICCSFSPAQIILLIDSGRFGSC